MLLGIFKNRFQGRAIRFRIGRRGSEITPLAVFRPVTIAVIPAAESVTQESVEDVSERPICGMRWMYSARGSFYAMNTGGIQSGNPPGIAEEENDILRGLLREQGSAREEEDTGPGNRTRIISTLQKQAGDSYLEEDLSLVQPVAHAPEQREYQHLLRDCPEIAQELEIIGEVLRPRLSQPLMPICPSE